MQRLQSTEEAEVLIRAFGWFGPPAIFYGLIHPPECIDGRKRLEAAQRVRGKGQAPGVVAKTREAAARLLALVGHVQRAAGMLEEFDWEAQPEEIATILDVPRGLAAQLKRAATGKHQGHRTDLERPRAGRKQRRMRDCVGRLRALYQRALESPEPVTTEDLKTALGEWL